MDILALPVMHYVTATLFILICVLLTLVVLIQKGRGGGLSGAFGGVGGHSAFGAKTGDVFTWITVGLAGAFLVMAVVLNFVYIKLPATVTGATPPAAAAPGPAPAAPGGGPVSGATPIPVQPAAPAVPAPPTPAPANPAPTTPAPEKPAP